MIPVLGMTDAGSRSRNDSDPPHRSTGERARLFFDDLWTQGDYWRLETSEFDQARYARSLQILTDRRYARTLEIGCGAGAFTRLLAGVSDHVLGLDVSAAAIDRARARVTGAGLEFRVANIMETAAEEEGPWDLIVMNETVYYLGWLYSFFDVSWLAHRLFTVLNSNGRFLMANTFGDDVGYLQRPAVIRTYRDLFLNVGFEVDSEEVLRGTKDGVQLDVLMSLLRRPSSPPRHAVA